MPDDLRARLVDTGVTLVTEQGTEALSLREIARHAGVSHGAPRRYFPTHRDLLAAVARVGYERLGARIHALGHADDPRAGLLALGRLYLDFARTERGMFELMFRHELLRGNNEGLRAATKPLFAVLVDLVARARPGTDDATVTAGALWANLHGLAQLWVWGSLQMTVGTEDADLLLQAAVDSYVERSHAG
ncbi:TetR/AcrR family transcriptional regulator [Actinoplanes friuliensis]|jgi:AcrR family transcriptional regulator|uniref:Putative transcriptional regulator, TetR family protein n=1 Tax=Actinoplanes friuliensis DSM 7358 TaxID=1246995 RepID=U5W0P9_9ACTN|nr:TetR/AcrR family transcriptional regulator [Actinoplanes friuliensis]AGZ42699.1 putative transcriptional regulator, TetR family protein [Actinoplanes friuliensis DSM 7358]